MHFDRIATLWLRLEMFSNGDVDEPYSRLPITYINWLDEDNPPAVPNYSWDPNRGVMEVDTGNWSLRRSTVQSAVICETGNY